MKIVPTIRPMHFWNDIQRCRGIAETKKHQSVLLPEPTPVNILLNNETRKETNMAKKETSHPYQVPHHIYLKLEAEAIKQRKLTGKNITWSSMLRDILDMALGIKKEK